MAISTETQARESREDRFKLQQYVDAGLSEKDALLKLFPKDSNRRRKLKTWKDKGLFPIPESERAEHNTTVNTTDTTSHPVTEVEPSAPQTILPIDPTETTVEEPATEPTIMEVIQTLPPVVDNPTVSETEKQMWKKIEDRVSVIVDKAVEARLKTLGAGFHVSEKAPAGPGRYYKGGKTHTKINATIPNELAERLEQLGGIRSQHVSNAIKLYLEILKSSSDTTKP
jgi:hypothetical protein